ncbi:MAG: MAPEG family protein [Lysobacteraceae bacterium]
MTVIPYYAAVFACFYVGLSVRTLRTRRALGIAVGDGGNAAMLRAMRVHANFAEYVPFAVLLLWMLETAGAPAWSLHALASVLLAGRIAHAWGVSRQRERFAWRVSGMAATFTVLLTAAAALGLRAFWAA